MALYIRSLEESERAEIEDGLRSQNGIWARRCQVLWNSSRGKKVKEIAEMLGWHPESVRFILRNFHRDGLDVVRPRKRLGRTPLVKLLSEETLEQMEDLARQSPRNYGVDRAVWRSADLAEVAFEEGILPYQVHPLRLRRLFQALGYSWKLVKAWQISPDPDYAKKSAHRAARRALLPTRRCGDRV